MTFNATWSPGPEAVAGMQMVSGAHDQVALVIYLDPDSLAILAPRDPVRWTGFVRMLRELRDGADEMANFLEPTAKRYAEEGD
ncbi:hypothetical protein BAY61_04490 [Prauserella marina]|uniref:Uncharacterized protein n=1 Tax=Prauserella marina TaxID=530584 RepID=A0A222VKD6_9PSEU|nr:hypothetical protein [Prauserella marina]ASR34375.1 hypothetical protein BAY61_04490 [Prauserella marina]PWV71833.1 hypothetical protein DES30_1113 [Prauserella marina]SDD88940.1 hypothetical protein SAMN05421630_1142 [Prauserella marina]